MTGHHLGALLVASLDEEAIGALADRLRPYLHDNQHHPTLLTPAEAGERLRLHPKTVVRMARDGRLLATKIGTGWRFHPTQLDIAPPAQSATAERPCAPARRRLSKGEPASVRAIRGSGT